MTQGPDALLLLHRAAYVTRRHVERAVLQDQEIDWSDYRVLRALRARRWVEVSTLGNGGQHRQARTDRST